MVDLVQHEVELGGSGSAPSGTWLFVPLILRHVLFLELPMNLGGKILLEVALIVRRVLFLEIALNLRVHAE